MPLSSLNEYFLLNQGFYWSPELIDQKKINVKFQFQIILYFVFLETREVMYWYESFLQLVCVSNEFEKTSIN